MYQTTYFLSAVSLEFPTFNNLLLLYGYPLAHLSYIYNVKQHLLKVLCDDSLKHLCFNFIMHKTPLELGFVDAELRKCDLYRQTSCSFQYCLAK